MRTPDRFAQMVDTMHPNDTRMNMPLGEHRFIADTLLRRYHARVMRLVQQIKRTGMRQQSTRGAGCACYSDACADLLAALKAMKKGKQL
jgi:hypothetical protein